MSQFWIKNPPFATYPTRSHKKTILQVAISYDFERFNTKTSNFKNKKIKHEGPPLNLTISEK